MTCQKNSGPLPLLTTASVSGLLLVGCASSTEQMDAEPETFDNLHQLFSAVDEQLGCPEGSSDAYSFALPSPDPDMLHGRSCADSVVMAWSNDPEQIVEIQDMMATVQHTVPVIEGPGWFVADISEAAGDGEATDLAHPASRDLEALADSWNAAYTEY